MDRRIGLYILDNLECYKSNLAKCNRNYFKPMTSVSTAYDVVCPRPMALVFVEDAIPVSIFGRHTSHCWLAGQTSALFSSGGEKGLSMAQERFEHTGQGVKC